MDGVSEGSLGLIVCQSGSNVLCILFLSVFLAGTRHIFEVDKMGEVPSNLVIFIYFKIVLSIECNKNNNDDDDGVLFYCYFVIILVTPLQIIFTTDSWY